jgi:succinoglycan biosynthesis transport protein ExoP
MDTQKTINNIPKKQVSPSEQIHLSDYLAVIRKRKWMVIIFSLVLIGIVTIVSLISTPIYQATAQIIIECQPYPVTSVEEEIKRDTKEQDFYQTQYNLLQSRSLALKVIDDLKLWKDFQSGPLTAQGNPASQDKTGIIDWYLSNLKIEPVRGSRLINISFLSPSAETAARVANAHAHAFIERDAEVKLSGLNWLKSQIGEQKEKVETSQQALHEYKRTHGITSFEDRQNIISQKLMDLNANLTKVKSERLAKESAYNQLKTFTIENENIFSLPEVAQDSIILNLRNQLIQLKARRLEMATNYGPRHPKMIDLNSQIKQIEQELTEEVHRLSRSIKAELDRALAYEKSSQQALNAQKGEALSLNGKAINYDVLQQEAQSNQKIYDNLLKQAEELGLISTAGHSNIRLTDEAEVPPVPARPKTFLNILLSIVVSMFMGPFLAFFFEYMDKTIKTPEDVQRRLGVSTLGTIPYDRSLKEIGKHALPWNGSSNKKKKYHYVYDDVPGRFVTSLQLNHQRMPGQVLMVESATSGEGKTTILTKSAVSLARSGLRVVMVDADLERPALHQVFGLKNDGEGGLITAMERVLFQEISMRDLNTYSVDDLFFLISLKKLSGQLHITNETQDMNAVFENGRLLHIRSKNNPLANRLGTMLLRGGFITEGQLQEALERNDRTGQPLGYILINAGYITQDKLRGPLKLQMEEYLQKLFSWKSGSSVFEPGSIKTYEDKSIYFEEDYIPIIRRLGHMAGSCFIEREVLSFVKPLGEPNLSLLPAGTASSKPAGLVYLTILEKFLDILKKRFDIVLVDAPPVLNVAGAVALSSLSDGVVFVVKAGHLSVKAINEALTSLKEANINILGAILNQVKLRDNLYKY